MRKGVRLSVVAVVVAAAAIGGLLAGSAFLPGLLGHSPTSDEKQGVVLSGVETIKVLAPDGRVVSTWQGLDPLTTLAVNAIVSCITAGNAAGATTTPEDFTCSSWVNEVFIQWDSPTGPCSNGLDTQINSICSYSTAPASDTLTPVGCNPGVYSSAGIYCTGWITEATFGPATFTQSNCDTPSTSPPSCSVENVVTGNVGMFQQQTSVSSCVRGTCTNAVIGPVFDTLCTTAYGPYAADQYPACTLTSPPATLSPGDSLLVTIQFTVS